MTQAPESPEISPTQSRKPRLIELFRAAIRSRHYSRRTEKSYWYWVRYFIFFNGKRHPMELGAPEVTAFLSWLATERNVAAATQNQALSALLFLYKHVLEHELPWLDGMVRAKRPVRLPVVLTEGEVARLLDQLEGKPAVDGGVALRRRAAAARVSCAAHQGRRLRLPSDRGARGQGRQGPRDDAT
jgi:site-specific recombinase XerD